MIATVRSTLAFTFLLVVASAGDPGVGGRGQAQSNQAGTAMWEGTATVSGVVVADADGSTPIRRAVVTVQGADAPATRSVPTNDDGRFVVRGLPAGRYAVVARKAAYLDAPYGARRPGRPGTAVHVDAGQSADITIRMARGAVIEGSVRGEGGEPLPGLTVFAIDPDEPGSIGTRGPGAGDQPHGVTDDRGTYRIYGLIPGEYVVVTMVEPAGDGEIGRRSDVLVDAALQQLARGIRAPEPGRPAAARERVPPAPAVGYAFSYYPGTALFSDAARIRLTAGDERGGLDFVLASVPTVVMEGAIVGPPDQLAAAQLSLEVDGPRSVLPSSRPALVRAPGPDGRFRYTSVPPGRYTIHARGGASPSAPTRGGVPTAAVGGGIGGRAAGPGAGGARGWWYALTDVIVTGQDVTGITLTLQPGVVVAGRFVFDAASATPPPDVSTLRIGLASPRGVYMSRFADGTQMGNVLTNPPAPQLQDDGAFVFHDVAPGTYVLRSTIPADTEGRWWLRSAMLNGRDVLDEPLEVRGQSLTGMELTYTDRENGLTGTFQTATGQPVSAYYVIALPDDRSLWRTGSRRLVFTRPGTDGRFGFTRIPAGRYRLVALTDFAPSDFEDAAFLETIAAQGIEVVVTDGATTTQDIKIAGSTGSTGATGDR